MISKVGTLLGRYHTPHQFNSWIILTAIAMTLTFHGNFIQLMGIGAQTYRQMRWRIFSNLHAFTLITHRRKCQFPSHMTLYGESAGIIGNHGYLMTTIAKGGKRNAVACLAIENLPCDILCLYYYCQKGKPQEKSCSFHFLIVNQFCDVGDDSVSFSWKL